MLFALICTDKANGLDLRQSTRTAHLAYLESLGAALKGAGPFTDEAGQPTGSLVLVEAADMAAAKVIAANDPYAKAGLFASVDIRPWNWRIKNPEAK
jgi:uncharacterized protein YciI